MVYKKRLKIIIAGQKEFAKNVLLSILSNTKVEVVGYVREPGNDVFSNIADMYKIKRFGLDSLPDHDIGITAHYFGRIPYEVTQAATYGWIGYHPSLLPRHRGRNAVKASIGDIIVGGSVYWLSEKWDKGHIAKQMWAWRDCDRPIDLWINTLSPIGVQLVSNVINDITNGIVIKTPQNENFATYC